jgi:hypothetical protein
MKTPVEKKKQLIETYPKKSAEEISSEINQTNYGRAQEIFLITKFLILEI